MAINSKATRRILLLADESANWRIAGLRQLDRLACSLDRYAAQALNGHVFELQVFWRSTVAAKDRKLVSEGRALSNVTVVNCNDRGMPEITADLLLSTRLFVTHNGIRAVIAAAPQVSMEEAGLAIDQWPSLFRLCEQTFRSYPKSQRNSEGWRYMNQRIDGARCERFLLKQLGKPQDGLVSRMVNRPLTRPITRLLMRSHITPSALTFMLFVLPIAGTYLLTVGDYQSVVFGMLCYQTFSMLDGCDGELARAKYLESTFGGRFDTFCDSLGNILLIAGLTFGLTRRWSSTMWQSVYLYEGIATLVVTMLNEAILARHSSGSTSGRSPETLYPRHQQLVQWSGIMGLGHHTVGVLVQLTKRDVAIVAFLFLALIGQPQWCLHLLLVFGAISSSLAIKALRRE